MSSLRFRLLTLGTAILEEPDSESPRTHPHRPRHLALLACLAAAGPIGRTRGELVMLFWPRKRNKAAHHNLAVLESEMEKSLGVDLIEPTANDGRRLRSSLITSDVHDFREAVRGGRLADAVALYGGPFLNGLSLRDQPPAFGAWMAAERERLSRLLRTALSGLAESGQCAAVGHYWDRIERLADEDQEAAAAYVRCLARAGDTEGAIQEQKRLAGLLPRSKRTSPGALASAGAELVAGIPGGPHPGAGTPRPSSAGPDPRLPAGEKAAAVPTDARTGAGVGAAPGPFSAAELHAQGRERFRQFSPESLAQAEELFNQSLEAGPDYALAHAGLGSTFVFRYIAQPDPQLLEQGIRHLNRALELDPETGESYLWLAYAYSRSGDFDAASRAALQAVAHAENDPESHYFAAGAYHTRALAKPDPSYMRRAVHQYQQAVDIDAGYGWAWNGLAHLYMLHGQYGAAAKAIDQALAAEEGGRRSFTRAPAASGALTMRGLLLLREGNLDAAEDSLVQARERYFGRTHLWAPHFGVLAEWGLGRILELRGEFPRALQQYRTARGAAYTHHTRLGMGHHAVRVHLGLASVFLRRRERVDAVREAATAIEYLTRPKDFNFQWVWGGSFAETYFELARYLSIAAEHAAALDNLERAAQWGWSDPDAVKAEPAFRSGGEQKRLQDILDSMSRPKLPK